MSDAFCRLRQRALLRMPTATPLAAAACGAFSACMRMCESALTLTGELRSQQEACSGCKLRAAQRGEQDEQRCTARHGACERT
jgi:hypothetical protein